MTRLTHTESMIRSLLIVGLVITATVSHQPLLGADNPSADNPSVNYPSADYPGAAEPLTVAKVYGEGVRSTPHQPPEVQQRGFHLPPEFEIRLFAAEPKIAKPLNMAFDARGRLWVTQSVAYPYPAADSEARDSVMVLEDTDGDGTADHVTTFADHLNIPIGILPFGEGCLCFSIPNLLYLRDTDGDGRCDQREVVLGPFDTSRDTHGMINALRDGGDGWIYACHGFNNRSRVSGKDGHEVFLPSGNTFRFKPDGSRVEVYTHGQVNPFGMCFDDWGYLFTADCHSKPITQLVRGACYPSFGRPHDGLGFLPPMVDHLHGSTAICGILQVPSDSPLVPLRGQIISGNVMTSRLNRNLLTYRGATAKGEELPDFLTSDDPWFRPVDIQLGPDGHLYVADFYNRIIGHYEVPLDHPGRDRTSGRIWQIRYVGPPSAAEPKLDSAARKRVADLRRAGAGHAPTPSRSEARKSLLDENAHVTRAAAEFLGQHGEPRDVELLLQTLQSADPEDPVLRQTIRIAVRDLLARSETGDAGWQLEPDGELASILLGLKRPEMIPLLLRYLEAHPAAANRNELLAHAAKHATSASLRRCVGLARELTQDVTSQFELLAALVDSQHARPGQVAEPLRSWAVDLVDRELDRFEELSGNDQLVRWATPDGTLWSQRSRQLQSGEAVELLDSITRGESYTGRLVSDSFAAPAQIKFWLAGHNGFPDQPDHGKNRIQLVSAADGEILREATPPRNDVARQVHWDTTDLNGRDVRIVCIDGDSANAFAWLAVGRFAPRWILHPDRDQSLERSLEWIRRLGLSSFGPRLETLRQRHDLSMAWQLRICETIVAVRGDVENSIVLGFLRRKPFDDTLAAHALTAAMKGGEEALTKSLKLITAQLDSRGQGDFILAWARGGGDASELLSLCREGMISASAFANAEIQQTLSAKLSDEQREEMKRLAAGSDLAGETRQKLAQLQKAATTRSGNDAKGRLVFKKHCAACHQLAGEGAVIGPQLDGAVTRGLTRLVEDIVVPDQNVDRAFRSSTFLLDDGRVLVGLVRSENDSEITIADTQGKLIRIEAAAVDQRKSAGRSLMPSNFGEAMSENEFIDLLTYLRSRAR